MVKLFDITSNNFELVNNINLIFYFKIRNIDRKIISNTILIRKKQLFLIRN